MTGTQWIPPAGFEPTLGTLFRGSASSLGLRGRIHNTARTIAEPAGSKDLFNYFPPPAFSAYKLRSVVYSSRPGIIGHEPQACSAWSDKLVGEVMHLRPVMMTLRERGLLLPHRKVGSRRITWAEASYPAVHDLLTNPAYAGAYVFGRTRTEKRLDASGDGGQHRAGTAAGAVGGADHRPPTRLCGLGHPAGHPGPVAGQLQAAARGRRRRRPPGIGAAVRAGPLRPVRPDDAGRLFRPWR